MIKRFFANHKISAHVVFGFILILMEAYHNEPAVKEFALVLWAQIPSWGKQAVSAVAAFAMFYYRTQTVRQQVTAAVEAADDVKAKAASNSN